MNIGALALLPETSNVQSYAFSSVPIIGFNAQAEFSTDLGGSSYLPPVFPSTFLRPYDQTLLSCISVQAVRTALNTSKEIVKCPHNSRHVRRGILMYNCETDTQSLSSRNHHTNNLIWIHHNKYMSGGPLSPSPGDVAGTQKTQSLMIITN